MLTSAINDTEHLRRLELAYSPTDTTLSVLNAYITHMPGMKVTDIRVLNICNEQDCYFDDSEGYE